MTTQGCKLQRWQAASVSPKRGFVRDPVCVSVVVKQAVNVSATGPVPLGFKAGSNIADSQSSREQRARERRRGFFFLLNQAFG